MAYIVYYLGCSLMLTSAREMCVDRFDGGLYTGCCYPSECATSFAFWLGEAGKDC